MVWKVLPETLTPTTRTSLRLAAIGGNYLHALGNLQFGMKVVGLGLMAGANSLYITSGAEFVINILRLDATSFGWLFILHIAGSMLGAAVASALAGRMASNRQGQIAYIGLFASMALILATTCPHPYCICLGLLCLSRCIPSRWACFYRSAPSKSSTSFQA